MDLRTARVLKRFSQKKLEKVTGVGQPLISYAESGVHTLKPEQKKSIEKALDLKGLIDWHDEAGE